MTLQDALVRLYAVAKRRGVLQNSLVERGYLRSYFLYKRYLEDPFHGLIRAWPQLFRGGHVIDVGANAGYNATLFARAVDPGYSVFAFEPDPDNFRLLGRTARTQSGIVPLALAVGARSGSIELWRNPRHHGDHRVRTESWHTTGEIVRVPVVSLDDFAREQRLGSIAFVKIDVQGYELPVCEGLQEILQTHPTVAVALEYAPSGMRELGFEATDLLAFWHDRGFSASVIETSGQLRDVHVGQLDPVAASAGYVNVLFRRPV